MRTFNVPILIRNQALPIWATVRAYSQSDAILKVLEKHANELEGKDFRIIGEEIIQEQ